jgi:hypothetical protein
MGHDSTADGDPKSDEKPGPADDGSKVSATSMFAAIPAADAPVSPSVDFSPATARPESPAPKSPPSPQPGILVVHEVVFPAPGSRPPEGNASILSTLRSLAADEKVRAAELPPSSYVRSEPPQAMPSAEASFVPPPVKPGADVSFVQSPVSAGFTELLRALSETPAPPPVSPPPPVETNPSPPQTPSSSASFTRLLRGLDAKGGAPAPPTAGADAVSIPKRAEPAAHQMPAPPPRAEDATTLTRREPEVTAMSPAPAAAPTAAFPSPPIRRTPESELKVEPSAPPSAGSFTQLFQALDHGGSDRHAPVSETPPATAAASHSDASKSAGSFTDLFQAIDSGNSAASSPAGPVAAIPSASTAPITSAPPSGDGSTQMFQAIDRGNASSSAPVISGSATEKAPVAPETQSAESFTQLFRAIESGASNIPPGVAPASANQPPNVPPIAPAAPSGASFTELFRAIDPDAGTSTPAPTPPVLPSSMAAAPAAHEAQPAGSFTQMFSAVDSSGIPGGEPSRSPQSWGQTPPPRGGPVAPPPRSANPPVADPQRSDGSSLTQLLRTLDQSDATPDSPSPTPVQPPGPFTSIYGERSPAGNQVERMQPAPATPDFSRPPKTDVAAPGRSVLSEPAAPASGSSDFTRILQASSMREQALKRGEQPIEPPQQPTPANPPAAQPQMPGFPVGSLQFPHSNALPPLNFGHGSATPPLQSFKGAPNLTPPQWMPPAPPPPTPAPVSKTPLLPLVLIGIIFVLVVVLVAVVFLFKH